MEILIGCFMFITSENKNKKTNVFQRWHRTQTVLKKKPMKV